jgi:hypothetical protein
MRLPMPCRLEQESVNRVVDDEDSGGHVVSIAPTSCHRLRAAADWPHAENEPRSACIPGSWALIESAVVGLLRLT